MLILLHHSIHFAIVNTYLNSLNSKQRQTRRSWIGNFYGRTRQWIEKYSPVVSLSLVLLGLGTRLIFSLAKWRFLAIDADLGDSNLTSILCGAHCGENHHGATLHYLLAQILWRYCTLRKSMTMIMAKDTIWLLCILQYSYYSYIIVHSYWV